jgi:hypothetical protein
MIIFEMPPPPSISMATAIVVSNITILCAVSYIIISQIRKNREKVAKNKRFYYSGAVALFMWVLMAFPVTNISGLKNHFKVWKKYQLGNYSEHVGAISSVKYLSRDVWLLIFSQDETLLTYTDQRYCFDLSRKGTGIDIQKSMKIRYVPFGDPPETAYCVVYVEQDT